MATVPIATYRIQLTPTFGFAAATEVVPELARLGVSHVYLSPVAEAVTGSTHGYDVVDPATVRAELGGADELWRLAALAGDHGLGVIVDIVPNHVSIAEPERNAWWWGLLRDGPEGSTADHFDVDWPAADGKVIVPVLGRPLDDAIAAGEITVEPGHVRYFERAFPRRSDEPGSEADDVTSTVEHQHYRLTHWRDPARNVRRFFTIDDLVAIRPEVPEVSRAVHATVAALAGDGLIDGVRVDHVDGLADPAAYLADLRGVVGEEAWILVEKILVGDERRSAQWEADGTTGYEWITLVDHVFTHPRGEAALTALWQEQTGDRRTYHEHETAGVRDVLDTALRPDLERVVRTAERLAPWPDDGGAGPGPAPEARRAALERAIVELTVRLGRYRTYLVETADDGTAAQPQTEQRVLRDVAELVADGADEGERTALAAVVEALLAGTELTRRWQQLTGPALAKGGEDRALYRSLRLAAHNEVGGDPGAWTRPVEDLHRRSASAAATDPQTLLAGSTHDTKRSEDVRSRLLVLAEVPDRWASTVEAWRATAGRSGAVDLGAVGGAMLLLAFQTAVGAWPIDARRLGDYLVKASREAGELTSWTEPADLHERELRRLAALLTRGELAGPVTAFVELVAPAGRQVALAQLALRLTSPGVPDLYQGSESWLLTLVDPDNRAPLDTAALRAAVDAATAPGSVWTSSAPKAALLGRVLQARRRNHACFAPGSRYEALPTSGRLAEHVIAFVRRPPADGGDRSITTVASRFPLSRPDGWLDTVVDLPPGPSRDLLGGPDAAPVDGRVRLTDLLGDEPAAVLEPVG